MPRATVSTEATHYNLETVPEGWVKLRALSYGEKKRRADRAGTAYTEQRGRTLSQRQYFQAAFTDSTLFDYSHCVVDHYLEVDNGRNLDFSNPRTLDVLDPRVGDEIEKLMSQLNGDEEDLEDFISGLSGSPGNGQEPSPQSMTNSSTQTTQPSSDG